MTELLSVQGLVKRYRPEDAPAVDRVSFDVAPGETVALLGESGCGKTTTLRLISGFERADEGHIFFEGRRVCEPALHVAPEKRNIGFVFQDYALFPHWDVRQNVLFGLKHLPRASREALVGELLERMHLTQFARRKPHELSGGQQQRVALARSMAPAPKLILLDEPFSNLDAGLRKSARREVRELLRQHQMAAVFVTHDREEALGFADRVGVMHEGRLAQLGPPEEIYCRPRTQYVARFIAQANLFPVSGNGNSGTCVFGEIPLDRETNDEAVAALRPEQIMLEASSGGETAGTIIGREFRGALVTYQVRVRESQFTVDLPAQHCFETGDRVRLQAQSAAVVLAADE